MSQPATTPYRIASAHVRVGCDYCFFTLNPLQGDALNQAFAHCNQCQRNFHAAHVSVVCPICGSNRVVTASVAPPRPLKSVSVRRPLEFVPAAGGTTHSGTGGALDFSSIAALIRHNLRLIALGVLALIFVAIAAGLGAYTGRWVDTYELWYNSSALPQRLVDAVLREPVPNLDVFAFALLAALVTAYALFPVTLRNKLGYRDTMRWVWRVIGGLVLLVSSNIIYYQLNLNVVPIPVLLSFLPDLPVLRESVLAQLGAITLTTVLAVPYLYITRHPPAPPSYPFLLNLVRGLAGLARYGLVFYIVLCLAVSVGMIQLGSKTGFIVSFMPADLSAPSAWEARGAILALSAAAIGLLLYQFPYYRLRIAPMNPLTLTIRILGCLGCLGLIALIYNRVNTVGLVEAAVLGGGLGIALWAVQRAYT